MPSMDESIETAIVAIIAAVIPTATVHGRKKPGMREGDPYPIILVRCEYDGEDTGDNSFPRNVAYIADIFIMTRSSNADTGDETIKAWRQLISKSLYGPTMTAVPEVDNITSTSIPSVTSHTPQEGVDTEILSFEVETYESLS